MTRPIFLSYASDNRLSDSDRVLFDDFVRDLLDEMNVLTGVTDNDRIFFSKRDIEVGGEWPAELGDALREAQVMLCFASPHYFNSAWCGREFGVFRSRRVAWVADHPGKSVPTAIVPIRWIPTEAPEAFRSIQDSDDHFPADYRSRGLRKLLQLERKADRTQVVASLADRLVRALKEPRLPVLPALEPVHLLDNAFAQAAPAGAAAHAAAASLGGRACFVFIAATQAEIVQALRQDRNAWGPLDGWDWRPFHPFAMESVGALAQRMAGDRNLRFVQLDCDANLMTRLKEAKQARVPVVIFADPWTARLSGYRQLLSDYDDLNLLNCAVLVPWNRDDPETAAEEAKLRDNLRLACQQKMSQQYPTHYWNIATTDEFRLRALTVLDEITVRLLDGAKPGDTRRAESPSLEAAAKQQGIETHAQPHLVADAALSVVHGDRAGP